MPGALVTRLTFEGRRVCGVQLQLGDNVLNTAAACEVMGSLGAIHTAKLLMQSGIGNEAELQRFDIQGVQHLPGVGRNLPGSRAEASPARRYGARPQ